MSTGFVAKMDEGKTGGKSTEFKDPLLRETGGGKRKNGGESGIRTRGTPLKGVQSLSRRSLSATQPSLRDLFYDRSQTRASGSVLLAGSRIHIDRLSFRIFSIL
jgi:hypothetical protein